MHKTKRAAAANCLVGSSEFRVLAENGFERTQIDGMLHRKFSRGLKEKG